MTDRMTLPEAREVLDGDWEHLTETDALEILALLDHLAAQVEAGEELRRRAEFFLGYRATDSAEDLRAALARWEGLSK